MSKKRWTGKLRSRQGFTLVEMLLTVIILSVITVAVTAGAMSARNVYQKVRQKADAQTLMATVVSAMSADLSTAHEIKQDNQGAWTFISGNRGYRMKYANGDPLDNGIQVVPVIDGTQRTVSLVTEQTQTLGLYAKLTSNLSWSGQENADSLYFTAQLAVCDATGKEIEKQTVNIRPLMIDWE